MAKKSKGTYSYSPQIDEKRPWRISIFTGSFSDFRAFHTEAEARTAIGLKGGSKNPHYIPKSHR